MMSQTCSIKGFVEPIYQLKIDNMKQTMIDGESIKLVHFGTFTVRNKAPRRGRNPRTGDTITITKRQAISFRPSKKLRELVNK